MVCMACTWNVAHFVAERRGKCYEIGVVSSVVRCVQVARWYVRVRLRAGVESKLYASRNRTVHLIQ